MTTLNADHFQTAIENLHDAVMISQCKGGNPLVFVNEQFTELTGYILKDVQDKPFEMLYAHPDEEEPESLEVVTMQDAMKNRSATLVNLRAFKKDGTGFHAEVSVSQVKNPRGRTTHYISIIRDVSVRVELEKQLFAENAKLYEEKQALQLENKHDLVTGLLNRSALHNEVKGLFSGAKRAQEHFTMMFIGLDNYALLSKQTEPSTFDARLKEFAGLLSNNLKRDSDIIFRYQEDEFIICFTGQNSESSEVFANKIIDLVKGLANKEDAFNQINIAISVGMTSASPKKDTELTSFILSADLAMQSARKAGGNQVVISNTL